VATLLIYATTHGHTARIADHLAEALRGHGVAVDLRDVKQIGDADAGVYDAVVAGASLHAGHHQRAMVNWVKANRDKLAERTTLFISVSLTAADDTPEARETTQRSMDDFEEETGWKPTRSEAVAGALQYLEYDVFTRVLMRLKMRHGGDIRQTLRRTTNTPTGRRSSGWPKSSQRKSATETPRSVRARQDQPRRPWCAQRPGGRRPTVFLDYGGVLTPIVDRPEDPRICAALGDAVRGVSGRTTAGYLPGSTAEVERFLDKVDP